jgi:hypothetical protein
MALQFGITALVLGLFAAFNSNADVVLSTYDCPSEVDLNSCSSRCVRRDLGLLRILVSVESKAVMVQHIVDRDVDGFKKGSVYSSSMLSNCVVFDEKNFDCTSSKDYGLAVTQEYKKMTSRVYVSYTKTRTRRLDIGAGGTLNYGPFVSTSEPIAGFCAK